MEKKAKILICEDELIIALDLKNTLVKFGHEVISIVKTGEELLRLTKESQPDLIISDIRLHGNNTSVDALKTITENYKIPVIFLSGLSNTLTLDSALLVKPCYYLAKPFDEGKLQETINLCLNEI